MPFVHSTRIRFVDTDASGRIHYTSLFKFFESAETELFRSLGFTYISDTFGFPRVHAECDIQGALRYDDLIDVEVYLTKLGNSSMRFEFKVIKESQVAATGAVVMVCLNKQSQRAMPIPEEMRVRFQQILVEAPK